MTRSDPSFESLFSVLDGNIPRLIFISMPLIKVSSAQYE